MKQTIKLKESELRRMIKNCIQESIIHNAWMYDDYDNFTDDYYMFGDESEAQDLRKKIEAGDYDKQLMNNPKKVYSELLDQFEGSDSDYAYGWVRDALDDRRLVLDKSLAMKVPLPKKDFMYNTAEDALSFSRDVNDNIYPNSYYRDSLDQSHWLEHWLDHPDTSPSRNEPTRTKTGRIKDGKAYFKALNNRRGIAGAKSAADKVPLHRKGSLNRAMDDWHGKK